MKNIINFIRENSVGFFLITFGIVAILVGTLTFISVKNSKNFIKTEAIVTKAELFEEEHYDDDTHYDATYTIYVKYTVNDRVYNEEYGIYSGYKVGDKVTIAYNPKNPSEIVQPMGIIIPIIILSVGLITIIIGIIKMIKKWSP